MRSGLKVEKQHFYEERNTIPNTHLGTILNILKKVEKFKSQKSRFGSPNTLVKD
jgi:hypothetical protein